MKVISVIFVVIVVALCLGFSIWNIFGLVRDIKNRKLAKSVKQKDSKSLNNNKEN